MPDQPLPNESRYLDEYRPERPRLVTLHDGPLAGREALVTPEIRCVWMLGHTYARQANGTWTYEGTDSNHNRP